MEEGGNEAKGVSTRYCAGECNNNEGISGQVFIKYCRDSVSIMLILCAHKITVLCWAPAAISSPKTEARRRASQRYYYTANQKRSGRPTEQERTIEPAQQVATARQRAAALLH